MGKQIPLALALLLAESFSVGREQATVNNDIVATLPRDDKVVLAAEEILRHHPVLDNIFIQISSPDGFATREDLVKAADLASNMLAESGLARVLSGGSAADTFAILLGTVTDNLPFC
jgi:DNA-directed RNA polymerase subunit L